MSSTSSRSSPWRSKKKPPSSRTPLPREKAVTPPGLKRAAKRTAKAANVPTSQVLDDFQLSVLTTGTGSGTDLDLEGSGKPRPHGLVGWATRFGPEARDVTELFETLYAAALRGEEILPPDAKDYVYVLVPGLFGNLFPLYMSANLEALRTRGLHARFAPISTQASVDDNAAVVRCEILKALDDSDPALLGKQTVLIGHSKGGLDSSTALSLFPELKPWVRALVTLQTPFGGSPIAQDLVNHWVTRLVGSAVFKFAFGGDPQAIVDLSHEGRRAHLHRLPYSGDDVPTVALTTWFKGFTSASSLLGRYNNFLHRTEADGPVPAPDAIVPGGEYVALPHNDHLGPIFSRAMRALLGTSDREAEALTLTLVTMALLQAKAREEEAKAPPPTAG